MLEPCTHGRDMDKTPNFLLQLDPVLALTDIYGVNQRMEARSFCLSIFLYDSNKLKNKYTNLKFMENEIEIYGSPIDIPAVMPTSHIRGLGFQTQSHT